MLYYYNEKEIDKFYKEDVVFFCNGAGDICIDGKDKKEEDLPEDLRRAYQELWSENTGSYCYLCQFKGKDCVMNSLMTLILNGEKCQKKNSKAMFLEMPVK